MNDAVSEKNKEFWSELCGSQLAKQLGIQDNSKESLLKYDKWFMDYYPYLYKHIPFKDVANKDVLEVGLGYGTVAQKLMEHGARYQGLDIASGPVEMVGHRISQSDFFGQAHQGSILDAPFSDNSFDYVVAIGCYHHTGDMHKAINETWRILKNEGVAIIMVYNAYSYRRWLRSFSDTFSYFKNSARGDFSLFSSSNKERGMYDVDSSGNAAPHTDFFSSRHINYLASSWSSVSVVAENIGDESFLKLIPRKYKLHAGKYFGLDIYCQLVK
ncbi:MAG: class I SAM-dependent methyltransferase [Gammaproteobacteria bacterium]